MYSINFKLIFYKYKFIIYENIYIYNMKLNQIIIKQVVMLFTLYRIVTFNCILY